MKPIAFSLLLFLCVSAPVFAQKSEVFTTPEGAIHGYDPVAYFQVGKPVVGKKEFVYSWKGSTWYFSSQQNKEAFQANPEKFAPQYGGYCAYGTADGHKAPTDPQAWTIVGNKLYLNYDKGVQTLWNKDRPGYIKKADEKWPAVSKQE